MTKTKRPTHGGPRNGAGRKVQLLRLSMPESMLVIDALNGTLIDPPEIAEQLIWQEVEEAISLDHLDTKWSVDGAALVATLRRLTNEAALELLAQVKQFWQTQHVS